ncbi:MAG TPA: hypothetical protein PLP42_05035 [Acidobacteriota bacterium]|nr:hypothetical protein [Acidobacteriota bacterium]
MTRRKQLLLFILLILLCLQLPFVVALYRTHRVYRYLAAWPVVDAPDPPFRDVRGGIHIHSAAGGHSLGTYLEIIEAAKQCGYQYAFITEHPKAQKLFQQLTNPDVIMIYGWDEQQGAAGEMLCTEDRSICFQSGEDRPVAQYAKGLEVFNLHRSAVLRDSWFNRISFFYHRILHPELYFFKLWEIDRSYFRTWDRELLSRRLTGIGGSDAHQNIGIVLQTTSGHRLFRLMVDPYSESFTAVTTHVFLFPDETLSRDAVLASLVRGSVYIAFEKLADPTGFSFHAIEDGKPKPMGSTVRPGARLVAHAPRQAEFHLIHNGEVSKTVTGPSFETEAATPGFYRLEVYPPDPPAPIEGKPWIISNPIFVR